MKFQAKLYFEYGQDGSSLAGNLLGLPEAIRPVYFGTSERRGNKANLVANDEQFAAFLAENRLFFLHSEDRKALFDIAIWNLDYATVTVWLRPGPSSELLLEVFARLAEHRPVFGFACHTDEREHRNRYCSGPMGASRDSLECWIGSEIENSIPGVYWCTMLSDGLLDRHGVQLADLAAEARSCQLIGDGSWHLLRFHDQPEDWKENAQRLDDLCERIEGVFSRRSVDALVASMIREGKIANSDELGDFLWDNWR